MRKSPNCAAFLLRAAAHFASHGIAGIERLMTDNAWAYRYSSAVHQAALPWQNGKAERSNRTLQVEWAHDQVFTSNAERTADLTPWLHYYNTERRHTALDGLPPTSRVSPRS